MAYKKTFTLTLPENVPSFVLTVIGFLQRANFFINFKFPTFTFGGTGPLDTLVAKIAAVLSLDGDDKLNFGKIGFVFSPFVKLAMAIGIQEKISYVFNIFIKANLSLLGDYALKINQLFEAVPYLIVQFATGASPFSFSASWSGSATPVVGVLYTLGDWDASTFGAIDANTLLEMDIDTT